MNIDSLPEDFAPYHLVRLDGQRVQCWGRYFNRALVLQDVDQLRRTQPQHAWSVLHDGGVLDETPKPAKTHLKLLRRAA